MSDKKTTVEIGGQQFTGRRMGGAVRALREYARGVTGTKLRTETTTATVAAKAGKRGKK